MILVSNPTLEVIRSRRSVRKFKPDAIPEEHLTAILDAARLAPTSGNQQPWKFLVIRNREAVESLKTASLEKTLKLYVEHFKLPADQLAEQEIKLKEYLDGFLSAPAFITVLVDRQSRYPDYNKHDGPLAAENLILAAASLGYGTVYGTDAISADALREIFSIPERYEIVCFIPIGIPDQPLPVPEKQPLESFIVEECFSE